jgi:hypothetical protein
MFRIKAGGRNINASVGSGTQVNASKSAPIFVSLSTTT